MENTQSFLQQNTAMGTDNLHLNDEAKIQELLKEQEKLQTLYNEVVAYIQQHPQMPTEEMIKYQTQLKQLSEYYQSNQQKLKTLGYSTIQVNKQVVIKSGAKKNISLKTLFLGCSFLIFIFLIGLIFLFFYLVKNPAQFGGLESLGISASIAKSLLQGLSLTVMLIVLLLGIIILIINIYKAFSEKNKSKVWYYGGIVLGIVILALGLGVGTKVLSEIEKINIEELTDPGSIVSFYMNGVPGEKQQFIKVDGSFPLIAPTNISAHILPTNFQNFLNKELGSQIPRYRQLDCGNGQILNYLGKGNQNFERPCFYTKKGEYLSKIIIHYTTTTNEQKTASYPLNKITIGSELTIQGIDKQLSGGKNELVI